MEYSCCLNLGFSTVVRNFHSRTASDYESGCVVGTLPSSPGEAGHTQLPLSRPRSSARGKRTLTPARAGPVLQVFQQPKGTISFRPASDYESGCVGRACALPGEGECLLSRGRAPLLPFQATLFGVRQEPPHPARARPVMFYTSEVPWPGFNAAQSLYRPDFGFSLPK